MKIKRRNVKLIIIRFIGILFLIASVIFFVLGSQDSIFNGLEFGGIFLLILGLYLICSKISTLKSWNPFN